MPPTGGRPRAGETRERTRRFLQLLADGLPPHEAARAAGVKPERVLRLLADPQFRGALVALLEAQEGRAA